MNQPNLKQLDERIRQSKVSDLLAMNQLGEQTQIMQESRAYNVAYLVVSGFTVLTAIVDLVTGSSPDYILLVFGSVTLVASLWALIKRGVNAMLAVALGAALIGIYHLIVISILEARINKFSIVIGVINIAFALQYIQQANRYQALEAKSAERANNDNPLYQDIFAALSTIKPNTSNNLIELKHLTQRITVWLRSSGVVIFLHSEKRLFFDTSKSFVLNIKGQDTGGDKVNVLANIIDQRRNCSITRHAWLRYIQFSA